MRKPLFILIGIITIIVLVHVWSSFKNSKNLDIKTIEVLNLTNNNFANKDFKAKNNEELGAHDFETAYKLGKAF